jgi:hypothetical protein
LGLPPNAINDSGQIVGQEDNHGFLYSHGVLTSIEAPGASAFAFPFGINNRGQITGGFCCDATGYSPGFVDTNGSFTTISVPGSSTAGFKFTAPWPSTTWARSLVLIPSTVSAPSSSQHR